MAVSLETTIIDSTKNAAAKATGNASFKASINEAKSTEGSVSEAIDSSSEQRTNSSSPSNSSPPPSSPPPSSPPPSSPPPSSPPPSSSEAPTTSPNSSPPPSPPLSNSPPSPRHSSSPDPPPSHSQNSSPPLSSPNTPSESGNSGHPPPVTPSPPSKSDSSSGDSSGRSKSSPPTQFVSPPALSSHQVPNKSPGQDPSPKLSPGGSGSTPHSNSLPQSGSSTPQSGSSTPHSGSPSSLPSPSGSGGKGNGMIMVYMAVGGFFIIAFVALVFFVIGRHRKQKERNSNHEYLPPANFSVKTDGNQYGQQQANGNSQQHSSTGHSSGSQRGIMYPGGTPDYSNVLGNPSTFFTYEEVMEITHGFSQENVIGQGGFGCVYKGFLPEGKVVAVKQLKEGSCQGDREFKAEVDIITRVHHRYLVSLVGYCIHEQHRLLIYEYVPNKTLEHHLHGEELPVLDWTKRLKIAVGAAKCLAYLHEDCHPTIIHRDIKSSNILLDDAFEAQVADFGLARLIDNTQTHVSTRVMGTWGYLAPEYVKSGKLTDKSDVFSFGVVLLELITGRKALDPNQDEESLVEWARPLILQSTQTGDISKLVDPRLKMQYVESEMKTMIRMAAACVRHSAPNRPSMGKVVRALDTDGQMSDICNGIEVGQSTAYDSGRYSKEISMYRRMAEVGFDDSSDFDLKSGDYSSREAGRGTPSSGMYRDSSSELTGNESESRAFNTGRGFRI